MESIYSVRNLLQKDCFMAKIDLKDSYLHISIWESSQKFLRIAIPIGKKVYHFQTWALPFGLSSSPRIFTKILAEALAPLRLQAITINPYLDDLLFIAPTKEKLLKDLIVAQQWLSQLGWIINREKSNLFPSQEILFAVYTISSKEQKIILPLEKVDHMGQRIAQIQTSLPVTIRAIMSGFRTYDGPPCPPLLCNSQVSPKTTPVLPPTTFVGKRLRGQGVPPRKNKASPLVV